VIEADGVTKRFKLYEHPADRLKERLLRRPRHQLYTALDGVGFSVASGESLGVIGRNGAGKSSLLKVLLGVSLPDAGRIRVAGRVTGLLELGTGFDADMTGEENIVTNGLLLGMTRKELAAKHDAIAAFSELGHFLREPLRTYSSGMIMRLAFAVAIHADPDTFVVDEALSVGDAPFQQKCMARIRAFQRDGGSLVFVSHDLNAVKMLCDRVLVLEEGRPLYLGAPEEAVNVYNALIAGQETAGLGEPAGLDPYGSGEVVITSAAMRGESANEEVFTSGETVTVAVQITAREAVTGVTLGMVIRDRFGQDIFGTNGYYLGHLLAAEAGETRHCRFRLPLDIAPGSYTLSLALHQGMAHTEQCYHWWDGVLRFDVSGIRGVPFSGVCNLHPVLESAD